MKISPFKLERYFDKYEFSAPYLLSSSDCEPLRLNELLELADEKSREEWGVLKLGYTESQGDPTFRSEISKLYSSISQEDVLVLVPEEGIFIAMNVLLDQGDHVVTTFPGYQSLYQVAEDIGCPISKWEPDQNLKFQVQDLKALVTDSTKLIVINFPHNPTGALISENDLIEIVNIAREKGITIFSDEMYRFMEYDKKDRLPSVSDLYENAISLFGLSKTFGLPGLRMGWLTTQNKKFMEDLITFKDYTTICNNAPGEKLGTIALQNKSKLIQRSLKIIQSNLTLLEDFAQHHNEWFLWKTPKAGSIAFPELKIKGTLMDFCQDLVKEKGIMLLPHNVYDFSRKHVRVGFGRKNLPEVLNVFEEYLKERNPAK
ncbi:MAG: aminotransferase class I/II-fold pyridoxal phosphate-dependent enzyme [Cyclobacteriaceae bacterium]